jgi:hypothetical protein
MQIITSTSQKTQTADKNGHNWLADMMHCSGIEPFFVTLHMHHSAPKV